MSIALIPVTTAAIVETIVNARLAMALGRLKEPMDNHVVVVGLGNVGTGVIRQLHMRGVPVVAIDKTEAARGRATGARADVPLVIGDASREETLRAASVQTCRALVVLSTDDVTNLEAALHARTLRPGLRVVLRLFDGDFADRMQRARSASPVPAACRIWPRRPSPPRCWNARSSARSRWGDGYCSSPTYRSAVARPSTARRWPRRMRSTAPG